MFGVHLIRSDNMRKHYCRLFDKMTKIDCALCVFKCLKRGGVKKMKCYECGKEIDEPTVEIIVGGSKLYPEYAPLCLSCAVDGGYISENGVTLK